MLLCVECLLTEHPVRQHRRAITIYNGNALCGEHLRLVVDRPRFSPPARIARAHVKLPG
jgi:hypothetical protein